jgi:outer membrane protein assembly factor BamB
VTKCVTAVLSLMFGLTALSLAANAEDWPWFLGQRHTGVSGENLQLDWTAEAPPVLWKAPIGTGYSAPSVLEDRVVVHHREGNREIVSCREVTTGKEIWAHAYPTTYEDPYGYNNGPRCSPVLTEERCFTLGAEGILACTSMKDGKPLWEADLRSKFTLPDAFFGVGCSPILDEDRLIVLVGGQPNSGVVAFDVSTGNILWQAVGKDTWDGVETDQAGRKHEWSDDEMLVSYSSPVIEEIHGTKHLLCLMRQGLVSLNPKNGEENFHYWFRPKVHESVNAARPVVIENRVFVSAAYQLGSAMLEIESDGKHFREIWRDRKNMLAHWSTPIHVDGCIYGFSGRHENEGELRCISVKDGSLLWQTTGYEGDLKDLNRDRTTGHIIDTRTGEEIPYPFYGRGSLIQVGKRFIVLGERGTISLVDVDQEKFREHGRFALDEIMYPAWAAPVLSDGRMYLRSEKWIVCLDLNNK